MARLHAEKGRYHDLRSTMCGRDTTERRPVNMVDPVTFTKMKTGQRQVSGIVDFCSMCWKEIRRIAGGNAG